MILLQFKCLKILVDKFILVACVCTIGFSLQFIHNSPQNALSLNVEKFGLL